MCLGPFPVACPQDSDEAMASPSARWHPTGWPTPGTLSVCGRGLSERTTHSDPSYFLILAAAKKAQQRPLAGWASEYLRAGGADRWGLVGGS